jgi:diaminohydroxyphosphoribosylaminopyrimidine deaminase / 5-amino-6-(5-phosphoribosylamino)uracil reductase
LNDFLPIATSHSGGPRAADSRDESWTHVPRQLRARIAPLPPPWEDIFGPLRAGKIDDLVVVAQIGQSLDGRVATTTGRSHYINGPAGLAHLHRLRALVDAVIVGVETASADDPQLTVRHVAGPNPVRVVLDPRGRLPPNARLLERGCRKIVITGEGVCRQFSDAEILPLPAADGHIAPAAILAGLAELGLRRVLVEGGADTVSRFLRSGCLDRVHVVVAPLILGAGRPSFAFGAIDRIDEAMRPAVHAHRLDNETLFDCDFSAQRVAVWRAQKSE